MSNVLFPKAVALRTGSLAVKPRMCASWDTTVIAVAPAAERVGAPATSGSNQGRPPRGVPR